MNEYKCFYDRKSTIIQADTTLQALDKAAVFFKTRKKHNIAVVLHKLNGKECAASTVL
jgi:hypothetical protein